jgi:hypothetical protein
LRFPFSVRQDGLPTNNQGMLCKDKPVRVGLEISTINPIVQSFKAPAVFVLLDVAHEIV